MYTKARDDEEQRNSQEAQLRDTHNRPIPKLVIAWICNPPNGVLQHDGHRGNASEKVD
jgi:hypothetical protein